MRSRLAPRSTRRPPAGPPPTAAAATLLLLLALLAPTPAIAGGSLPTIQDNSGAFTYTIPIDVPAGPADATPQLALSYSSAGGNAEAGIGWSLPYSAIRLDPGWGAPHVWLDGADPCDPQSFEGRLYLDGMELVPSEADPQVPDVCSYRTRPDTYTLVLPIAGADCGDARTTAPLPSGFAVSRADGTTWWYGDPDSCASPHVDRASDARGAFPTRWLLHHVQDRDGNLVTFWPERRPTQGSTPQWWGEDPYGEGETAACDGCLRAVTWGERLKDSATYAYDAEPGNIPPYGVEAADHVGQFAAFASDPARFWPTPQSHFYAVRVDWEPRPDVRTSFVSGAPRRLDRRVRQIAVLADANVVRSGDDVQFHGTPAPVRTYRLDYAQGSTARSRLTRVWPFAGRYREDAAYHEDFGVGLPLLGSEVYDPAQFLGVAELPTPWEFAWSENDVLAGAGEQPAALADFSVMDLEGDALPWLGASWREGGFPTISLMDLNGDSLPELVQHHDELPRYVSLVESVVKENGNPFTDQLPYIPEDRVALPDESDARFWVRWNRGDHFSDLSAGPVDPFALQEVGDFMPRRDCDGDGDLDEWRACFAEAEVLSQQPGSGAGSLAELLDEAELCTEWWTGAASMAAAPNLPNLSSPAPYLPAEAAWCEYLACAPYCEPATSVQWGLPGLAGGGTGLGADELLGYVPSKEQLTADGRSGGDLLLWRRYAVVQAASASIAATLQGPFPFDGTMSPASIEPRSVARFVDGYARASFSARIADSTTEVLVDRYFDDEEFDWNEPVSLEESLWATVRDGLVHDTVDINGDGFPDRVLGGAGVLENRTGLSPTKYSAPTDAILNPYEDALKGFAVSTAHQPWFVSLYDPEREEFGDLLLWDLPLTHDWLMGGPNSFDHGGEDPDPRLFSPALNFGFLSVTEMTQTYAPAPVGGNASMSPGLKGPSVGSSLSIGPVSIGASVSASGPGFSVGVGPVSFTAGGMSIGPVSFDFSSGVTGGAAGAFSAVMFVVQKALATFEIPFGSGISPGPDGFSFNVSGWGGDCSPCKAQARFKRQGLVDMNGDGLLDYVIAHNPRWDDADHDFFLFNELGDAWAVVLNEGDGFADEPVAWTGIRAPFLDYTRTDPYRDVNGVNAQPGFRRGQTLAGLQDMNGDGLVDFVYAGASAGEGSCELPPNAVEKDGVPVFDQVRRADVIDRWAETLCVQLNHGAGFEAPVDWFRGFVPDEVFSGEEGQGGVDGFVPALSATRSYQERSPTYNDGYAVGILGLQDWNGDGLPDFYRMVDAPQHEQVESRYPHVWLNDGRGFATDPMPSTGGYGGFAVDTGIMTDRQALPPAGSGMGPLANHFVLPSPVIDVSRTHQQPGGAVVQSMFLDLDGDGRLDWAQSIEANNDSDHRIRLYELQDAVPDLLTHVRDPGGAARVVAYGPARDHMDLPGVPDTRTLPDGASVTDGVRDDYPASSQVVVSTVLYDGLGERGGEPAGLSYRYGDPAFAHADPSLTAGEGLKHPGFRRRSMGWGRVVAEPCPVAFIDSDGGCRAPGGPEVSVVQDHLTYWTMAALPVSVSVIDRDGHLRTQEVTSWRRHPFESRYEVDPDPRSAFGVFNWHWAPTRVQSMTADELGGQAWREVAIEYEPRNGLASCTVDDLDGDGWGDRLKFTGWDAGLLDDGKLDVAAKEAISVLPLGAIATDGPFTCDDRMDELTNAYVERMTLHTNATTGRVLQSRSVDVAGGSPDVLVDYDYLPGGQLTATTNNTGATTWGLYDPEVGAQVIEERMPLTNGGQTQHVRLQEVCGLTTACPAAAWGRIAEEVTPDGNVVTNAYDDVGRLVAQSDLVHPEPIVEFTHGRAVRFGGVTEVDVGGLPVFEGRTSSVDGEASVSSYRWVDGVGRVVLTAESWRDEAGDDGLRMVSAGPADHRGRVLEVPGPCFVPGSLLGAHGGFLLVDPAAPDLGICASTPPRATTEYDVLGRATRRELPDGSEETTRYSLVGGATLAETVLVDAIEGVVREEAVSEGPFRTVTTRFGAVTHGHSTTGGALPGGLVPDASTLLTVELRDALGRRVEVYRTGMGSERTTFRYDGFDRMTRYSDPDQGTWELDYDADGRMAERRLLDPVTGAVELASEYVYDSHGRLLEELSYDDAAAVAAGQPSGLWEWSYDTDPGSRAPGGAPSLGSVGGEIGRPAVATWYGEDACGSGLTVQGEFTWRYDQRGRVTERAYQRASAAGGCAWSASTGPVDLVELAEYGPGNVRTFRWTPGTGDLEQTKYDSAGRPWRLTSSGHGAVVSDATYEIHGRLADLTYGNGVVQQYVYATGQTSSQALTQSTVWSASGDVLFSRDYVWDAAGNLRSWVDAAPADGPDAEEWVCDYDGLGTLLGCESRTNPLESMEYAYDVLGSLIREEIFVDGIERVASQYTRAGGVTSVSGGVAPLNAPLARVVEPVAGVYPDEPMSLFYDSRGHLVAQRYHDGSASHGAQVTSSGLADASGALLSAAAQREFSWDAKGRLESVSVLMANGVSRQVSRYWYSPDGGRVAERVTPEDGGDWTQVRRFAGVRLVEEQSGELKETSSWVFGSTAVGQVTVHDDGSGPQVVRRWTGGDHLGSASVVTDEDGELARGVRYEPYGRIRDEWGPEAATADYAVGGVDDLFNGKPRTRSALGMVGGPFELEAYDYGARLYLPELGRWASADSITPDLVWEANPFAYVRNNPLKYVDPDGHIAFLVPVFLWAAKEIGTELVIQIAYRVDPRLGVVVQGLLMFTAPMQIVKAGLKDMGVRAAINATSKLAEAVTARIAKRAAAKEAKAEAAKAGGKSLSKAAAKAGKEAKASSKGVGAPDNGAEIEVRFIAHQDGSLVPKSQSELVESILERGGTRTDAGPMWSEGGEIFRLDTPDGPMNIRVMDGKPDGGDFSGPRTVWTREGTNMGVHPSGAQVKNPPGTPGGPSKQQVREASHTHGQVNDRKP